MMIIYYSRWKCFFPVDSGTCVECVDEARVCFEPHKSVQLQLNLEMYLLLYAKSNLPMIDNSSYMITAIAANLRPPVVTYASHSQKPAEYVLQNINTHFSSSNFLLGQRLCIRTLAFPPIITSCTEEMVLTCSSDVHTVTVALYCILITRKCRTLRGRA